MRAMQEAGVGGGGKSIRVVRARTWGSNVRHGGDRRRYRPFAATKSSSKSLPTRFLLSRLEPLLLRRNDNNF